jgi:hypothetical protein
MRVKKCRGERGEGYKKDGKLKWNKKFKVDNLRL